ncbi:MAG: hypothetical protein JW769_01200 [Parachlamydiales bacterium]|nr:hypothetical protein [Parachlamydiales bacterium]
MKKLFLFLALSVFLGTYHPIFSAEYSEKEKGYTINFSNVSAIEYVRFVSKICNTNFIFNEEDLQFSVTVVSEEPININNILSTLTQILRINGLTLLEDHENIVIHKNPDVKQLAPLLDEKGETSSPIATQVFRIKNVTVNTLADVIRPMISKDALLETLFETRQIILTDTPDNIKNIAALIQTIDSPENPLTITSYQSKINPPGYLIPLMEKIITPTAAGNPFLLIPQEMTGSIYIVSTPDLIQRALSVLETIDTAPQKEIIRGGENENIFVYPIQFRTPDEMDLTLSHIAKNLEHYGVIELDLIDIIRSKHWIQDTRSFLFIGSQQAILKLQELLKAIDADPTVEQKAKIALSGHFFLYRPKNVRVALVADALKDVTENLHQADLTNPTFMQTMQSMQQLPSLQSLLFIGDPSSLERVQTLLQSIDIPEGIPMQSTYFLYKLQYVPGDVIEEDLEELAKKFKTREAADSELISILENAKWIKETNSILLTGDAPSVEAAKKLILEFDVPRKEQRASPHGNFFVYHPKNVIVDFIEKSLNETADNLEKADLADPNFLNAIRSMRYIESTDSIAFTGNNESLDKIKALIQTIDTPENIPYEQEGKATYFIYKIQQSSIAHMSSSVQSIIQDLKKSETPDQNFIKALESMRAEPESNSLVFTGTPRALDKVKNMIEKFDIPSPSLEGAVANSFFIYKPIHLSGPALELILKDFADNLKSSGFQNPNLYSAILSMRWVSKTQSLMFTGDQTSIDQIKSLLTTFDMPSGMAGPQETIQPFEDVSFLVYKLQYHPGDEIKNALKQIAKDLIAVNANMKENLLNAINSVQWIEMTNSLLCSGDRLTISRLKELIQSLDVPLKQVFIEILIIETTLTNLLNFGLDWGSKFNIKSQAVGRMSNVAPPDSTSSTNPFITSFNSIDAVNKPKTSDIQPFSNGFDLGVIGDIIMHKGKSFISLASLLNALQTDDETTIVMTPKMLAQDNKTSQIFIGRNLPYTGSQVQNTGQNTTVITSSLEYRDVGMKLALTPVMGNSDTITLTIDLESTQQLTDASGDTISTDSNLPGITTSKTSLNTTVHIPNKNFLVLSGMVNETKRRSKAGIPCLGGLPVIGAAFSKADKFSQRDNTVIFIRPHIINSYRDMRSVTENQEDFFRDNAGTATLEKDFEESIEMIKSYDEDEKTAP